MTNEPIIMDAEMSTTAATTTAAAAVASPQEHTNNGGTTPRDESTRMLPLHMEQHSTSAMTASTMTTTSAKDIPYEHSVHETLKTIAGISGNVLEWYDFAVFGFFGDIIADVFFPPQEGNSALVETFVIFGAAFLMRPVGGCVLGYIGDKYGRKKALELSIFLMAIPTFAMGMLPTYNQVGWIAILLLLVVRCLQGLSVGGQLMSSLVFTLESHPPQRWGLYGSYVMAAANFGTLLGGIIGFVMRESLSPDQMSTWGWRLPFLSGILVSLSGIYLRCCCPEDDPHLYHAGPDGPPNPFRAAFARDNRRSLLASTLVPILWSAGFYLCFVWLAIFMAELIVPPVPRAFGVNSASLLFSVCLLFPVAGHLSDKYGRVFIMTIGGISMAVLSPLLVIVVGQGNPYAAFIAQSILGIALSFWGSPMCAWLVEAFPPASRLTSVAIGYNLAQALVGGSTPALATLLVDNLGPNSPGLLLTGLAVISLIGLRCVAMPAPPQGRRRRRRRGQAQYHPSASGESGDNADHGDGIFTSSSIDDANADTVRPSSYEHPVHSSTSDAEPDRINGNHGLEAKAHPPQEDQDNCHELT